MIWTRPQARRRSLVQYHTGTESKDSGQLLAQPFQPTVQTRADAQSGYIAIGSACAHGPSFQSPNGLEALILLAVMLFLIYINSH